MAYVTKKEKTRYIEFGSFVVDYNDGDVILLDNVKDLSPLYPQKPLSTLIIMCQTGTLSLEANEHSYTVTGGTACVCPHSVRVTLGERSADFECKVLCLSDHLVRGLLRDRIDVWHHAVYVNQLVTLAMSDLFKDEFGIYFSLIRSKLRRSSPQAPYDIMLALLRALLLEMCVLLSSTDVNPREHKLSQGKVLFNRFLSLMSNSPVKRQPITYYAGQLAITPKYLTMLCLKYSDKTASEWVAQYTVEEIRYYLKSTDLSIKEISVRLGFSNMSHFGSYVRKHLGVSPSEYRYSKKG